MWGKTIPSLSRPTLDKILTCRAGSSAYPRLSIQTMGHHNQLRIFGMKTTSHSLVSPVPLLGAVVCALGASENPMTVEPLTHFL